MRLLCWLVFLFLGVCGGAPLACAQPTGGVVPGPFAFRRAGRRAVQVPMQLHRNLLVVNARLNGAGPFHFLLDTGVSSSIITSPTLADSLRLRHGQAYKVVGAGGLQSSLLAYQTDSVRVEMPGVVAPHMTWLVLSEDVLNLSGYVGVHIDGILGSELFRSFVVTLQPDLGQLVLSNPATYRPPRGKLWSSVPLLLQNNKAYVTVDVQLTDSVALPLKLVLDTGASHALSLEMDSDPRLVPPATRLTADLGRGLTGTVRGFLGRVVSLRLGRHALRSVLTSYPDAADVHRRVDVPRNGNVGYELLKRFSLVVDYPHGQLLLRPNARFRDPFEHDMAGVELLALSPDYHRFVVLRVVPASPAAAAGVEVNDELVSINFLPANVFTLTMLDRMLHSEDGRVLLLVLRRPDGNLYTAALRLKRQI